jgi:hypothetical protein
MRLRRQFNFMPHPKISGRLQARFLRSPRVTPSLATSQFQPLTFILFAFAIPSPPSPADSSAKASATVEALAKARSPPALGGRSQSLSKPVKPSPLPGERKPLALADFPPVQKRASCYLRRHGSATPDYARQRHDPH